MSEKQSYLTTLAREVSTTIKVLRAYPADQAELRPAPKSKTARELAFVFVAEQALVDAAVRGAMNVGAFPQVEGTIPEIVDRAEAGFAEIARKVEAMPDDDWSREMDFMVGPGKFGKVRRGDLLWLTLHDMIHHRGQFSVYLRMAGGKVPSIYGPSADEPWM